MKRFANVESKIPNYGKMSFAKSDANLLKMNNLTPSQSQLLGGAVSIADEFKALEEKKVWLLPTKYLNFKSLRINPMVYMLDSLKIKKWKYP